MRIKKFIDYIKEYQHNWFPIREYHFKDENVVTATSKYAFTEVYFFIKKDNLYFIDIYTERSNYDKVNKIKDIIYPSYSDISNLDELESFIKKMMVSHEVETYKLEYNDKTDDYTLYTLNVYHDLNHSKSLLNLLKFIKFKQWNVGKVIFDDYENTLDGTISDISKNINYKKPNIELYHGTSVEYLKGIMKNGLRPMPHQTNFSNAIHDKYIFLTKKITSAISYATTSVNVKNNTFGVIIELSSNDININKIFFDFDYYKRLVKRNLIKDFDDISTYHDDDNQMTDKNGDYILKYASKFSYKGVIYPNKIKNIYITFRSLYKTDNLYKIPVSDISIIYNIYDYCKNTIKDKDIYIEQIPNEELEKIEKYKVK